MNLLTINLRRSNFSFILIGFLFLQNLIIYWNHYFNGYFFLGDFPRAYFAKSAFITTAIDKGIFPTWVPFQNMGYPLFMDIQSGLYYPFLWIFPILDIAYTLNASAIFQVVHIFAGSVGMFFLLNSIFKSPKYAFFGAFAFQFFGGFYTTTAFPDVIRAYSLIPWMFYFFTIRKEESKNKWFLVIPMITFLMFTGGYPGIIISSFFIIGAFVIFQVIDEFRRDSKLKSLKTLAIIFALIGLGIGLSVVHIGPWLENSDQVNRLSHLERVNQRNLSVAVLPSLFMPSQWTQDIGTSWLLSIYVTLPVLILSCYAPFYLIKKYWPYAGILALGFFMAAGTNSFLYNLFGSILSPLTWSRIPLGDYKIFIVIPLIIFSIFGLKSIVNKTINLKNFVYRSIFVISWFSLTIYFLYFFPSLRIVPTRILDLEVVASIILLAITLSIIFYRVKSQKFFFFSAKQEVKIVLIFLIILLGIMSLDATRVILALTPFWQGDPTNPKHSQYTEFNFPLEKNEKLITFSIFDNLPDERPARKITEDREILSYVGYLDGSYMMEAYGFSNVLKQNLKVIRDNDYKQYMLMKWTPILLDIQNNSTKINVSKNIFQNIDLETENKIRQTHYGLSDIHYSVSLEEPMILIENEMYASGWKAVLEYEDKQLNLESIPVNDLLRGWVLPAGEYEMKASFEIPNMIIYQSISLICLFVWIIIGVFFWKKSHKTISNQTK